MGNKTALLIQLRSVKNTLGCVILPKVLGLITAPHFPIPLPMNKSPSEKKSNFFHFLGPANHSEVYSI